MGQMTFILLLGLIIRIIIATFTINWDFLRITQITLNFPSGGLFEIYRDPLSLYPVLTYWTRYALIWLAKPFLSPSFWQWNKSGDLAIISDVYIFRNLFFLKLPFILIEIATAYIFSSLLSKNKSKLFLLAWMINPIALYTITAFTNVDVFPIFFMALSLYFLNKKRSLSASFFLGVASAYKFFPLLGFPFLIFSLKKSGQKIYHTLIFLLPFIGSQIPALALPQYWKNSLTAPANRVILAATVNIGNNKVLILFVIVYFLLFFQYLVEMQKIRRVNLYLFLALSSLLAISAFNVQWAYWLLPLILYYQIYFVKEKVVIYLLYLAYFGIILLSQAALNIGMLSPIAPTLWTMENPLLRLTGKDVILLINICYSLFAAAIIYMSYRIYQEKNREIFQNEEY